MRRRHLLDLIYTTGLTHHELSALFAELIGPEAKHIMLSTGERIERRARAEGKAEGKAELLLTLLAAKFGSLPDAVERRVRSGSSSQLDEWGGALLGAALLEQVFTG